MRRLKQLVSEFNAAQILAVLKEHGIDVQVSKNDDHTWDIWVVDEDQHARASQLADTAIVGAATTAAPPLSPSNLWRQQQAAEQRPKKPTFSRQGGDLFRSGSSLGSLTIALVAVSIIFTFVLDGESYQWLRAKMYYSEYMGRGFPEILRGELWRIWTPIFIHGGFFHILFNMMMLIEFGSQIERQEGTIVLAVIVLGMGALVDTAQYLVSGPGFHGMSGVIYAMLGYSWMMARFSRRFNYLIAQGTVVFMVIWMGLCLVGVMGNVANTQHVSGFIFGVSAGYLRSGELKLWVRQTLRRLRK